MRDSKFTCASDVWALALVFIEILQYGMRPYAHLENPTVIWLLQNEDYEMIHQNLFEKSAVWSEDVLEILRGCLCLAEHRWSASELSQRLNKDKFMVYEGGVEYLPIEF